MDRRVTFSYNIDLFLNIFNKTHSFLLTGRRLEPITKKRIIPLCIRDEIIRGSTLLKDRLLHSKRVTGVSVPTYSAHAFRRSASECTFGSLGSKLLSACGSLSLLPSKSLLSSFIAFIYSALFSICNKRRFVKEIFFPPPYLFGHPWQPSHAAFATSTS